MNHPNTTYYTYYAYSTYHTMVGAVCDGLGSEQGAVASDRLLDQAGAALSEPGPSGRNPPALAVPLGRRLSAQESQSSAEAPCHVG